MAFYDCVTCLTLGGTWANLAHPNFTGPNGTQYSHVYAAECTVSVQSLEDNCKTTASKVPPAGDMDFSVPPSTCCAVGHKRAQKTSGWSGLTSSRLRKAEAHQLQLLQRASDGQLQAPLAVQQ